MRECDSLRNNLHSKTVACFIALSVVIFQLGLGVTAQVHIDSVDLLIITHEDFVSECERLSSWKNRTGMRSAVLTWQDLANEFSGIDLPERIKRGIANWYSTRGVRYVLLVGDADMFPVRYIAMDWNVHTPEPDKLPSSDFVYSASDLYYADLFNSSEDFHDWDFDKNGMYGELWGAWKMSGPINYDRLDMVSDVAVGRIPASTIEEVRNYVDKVISYETHASKESDWLMNALLVAEGVHELGQYDLSVEINGKLTPFGFSTKELYDVDLSNPPRPFSNRPEVMKILAELNSGKGYVNFAGHGNPNWLPSFGFTYNDYSVWFSLSDGMYFNAAEKVKPSFCTKLIGQHRIGDFDGDGDSDIIFFERNGTARYSFTTTFSGNTYINLDEFKRDLSPYFAAEPGYPKVGDFNGDGMTDLVQVNRTSGEIYVTLATIGGGTFGSPAPWGSSFCEGPHAWVVGDFNGDTFDDLLYRTGPAFYVAYSSGTGFLDKVETYNAVLPDSYLVPGDYNGDSLDDLALIDFASGNVNCLISTGQSFILNSSFWYTGLCPGDLIYGAEVFSGDISGDGFDDLVLLLKDSRIGGTRTEGDETYWERSDVWVLDSDGSGWISFTVRHDSFCNQYQIPLVSDVNGDDRDDLILFNRHDGCDPLYSLHNKDQYPILFASSCSTAEYAIIPPWCEYHTTSGVNMTGSNDGTIFPLTSFHGIEIRLAPTPHPLQPFDRNCIAERFLVQYNESGAVVYIGGVETLQGYINDLNVYFIESYTSGENILGNMWTYAIDRYLTFNGYGRGEHSIYASGWGDVASYQHPSKVTLFGDPSLRVFETPESTVPVPSIPPIHVIIIIGAGTGGVILALGILRHRNIPLRRLRIW
ncbi:hypothetical protein EU527_19380 [Candidatus Thorarchaeota archaeon]|nr:MAG: hypothetical protein EU527_19380 [Candidatus Thorarchaeota archaeon]